MRLLLQSAMIFFGTLLAAGLLALGEPQPTRGAAAQTGATRTAADAVLLAGARSAPPHPTSDRALR